MSQSFNYELEIVKKQSSEISFHARERGVKVLEDGLRAVKAYEKFAGDQYFENPEKFLLKARDSVIQASKSGIDTWILELRIKPYLYLIEK